ncbi:MAG: CDP-glucose 4,6-dehydratase [Lachnospiraceae bacterium]|nr:CDP-glucose 4,6-dehydratase [Lachnospiraceae bacterium]MBQ7832455.1 CDP-glucose 4,6-dehydratase [Lachnospiraceae bacterium]
MDLNFYSGKKVFITGHTGFKGAWLSFLLLEAGAEVTGYSLNPPTTPSLYKLCKLDERMNSVIGDIRDYKNLKKVFAEAKPDVVFHLAAQPLVRESYISPRETYETNVMGTVNILECVRTTDTVKSVIIVTTDKVYRNDSRPKGYVEDDILNGHDPYSNSKSCADILTSSYVNSFLSERKIPVSILRAGNVIGGGDFAKDRLVPDCFRAIQTNSKVMIRNPRATRPFQHVLEPLVAYLMIAKEQIAKPELAGAYNVGPDESDVQSVSEMLMHFQTIWNSGEFGKNTPFDWMYTEEENAPHEAAMLSLNCDKLKKNFNWQPKWTAHEAVHKSIEWMQYYLKGKDVSVCMQKQIKEYLRK